MPVSKEFKTEVSETKVYPDVPEGMYTLEIYDVSDVQERTYDTRNMPPELQEMESKLKFEFAILDDVKIDEENTTRGRRIWRTLTKYVTFPKNNKGGSNLFFLLRGIYGTEQVPKGEMTGSDINDLIGMQFMALVRNTISKEGKKYPSFELNATMIVKNLLPSYINDENNPVNKKETEDISSKEVDELFGESAIDKLKDKIKGEDTEKLEGQG